MRAIVLMILFLCNMLSHILNILNVTLITAIFILIFLDVCRFCTIVKEENIVCVRGLGLQVITKYVLGAKTVFIPQEQVQKIFINEVIFRNKVIFILNLLTKDKQAQDKLIPLFFATVPRLECLKEIYRHLIAVQE